MGKTWVLHTETKGTGAQMVPLESVEKRPAHVEPVFLPRKPSKPVEPVPPTPLMPARPGGVIEVTLANGVSLRVDAQVDGRALRRVLDALDRR